MTVYAPGATAPTGNVTLSFCGLAVAGFRASLPLAVVWNTAPASVPSVDTISVYIAGVLVVETLPSLRSGMASEAFLPPAIGLPGAAAPPLTRWTTGASTLREEPTDVDVRL